MGFLNRFKSPRDDEKSTPSEATQPETIGVEGFSPEIVASSDGVETGHEPTLPEDVDLESNSSKPTTPLWEEMPLPTVDGPSDATTFTDFDSEFAAPSPQPMDTEANDLVVPEAAQDSGEELDLEEWSEPLPSAAPPQLLAGATLNAGEGLLTIEEWLEARGGENIYRARWSASKGENTEAPEAYDAGEPEGEIVRLREASGLWAERLSREAMWRKHWDSATRIAMLPRLISGFKDTDSAYLATEMAGEGPTLAQFFALDEAKASDGTDGSAAAYLSETLLILAQVAAFLVRLHGAGFAHLGLKPDGIVPGKPLQILDCSFAAPLGEKLESPLFFAGYSAPELSQPGEVDARSDIYAVGALLYRAVSGSDVPESGFDSSTWKPRIVMAGVPQILRRCLGECETRFNSADELHRALVKLKSRLRPSVSHAICGLSTIGLESSRSTNQDAFGFSQGAWESESGPLSWSAFIVADGMGGMAAGEVASEVAVGAFLRAAAQWGAESSLVNAPPLSAVSQEQMVKSWAALANQAVVEAMEARHARGGCTLDAGLVIDRRLCIAHVGDARLYLLRGDNFQILSRDHSYVMSLLLQGQITFEEIRTHSDRNKVTRSLGERHPQPDYFIDGLQVQTGAPSLELQPGDVLLACSDGLWEPVLEAEMLAAISSGNLQSAAREMLRLALRRGAPDNTTLVLMRLDEDAAPVFA